MIDKETAEAALRVFELCREKKLTLATAESCTGGLVAAAITDIPGSSDVFDRGFVTYSNEAKTSMLDVPPDLIADHGAVSEETVKEMAEKVRLKFGTDIGVATSGIAGPGGGTPEKPVGTVWIACSYKTQSVARKLQLSKDRLINIKIAAIATLNTVSSRAAGIMTRLRKR